MVKHVKVWEQGWIRRHDLDYLVLRVGVYQNGTEIQVTAWKVDMRVATHSIAQALADHYDAQQWTYQAMWSLQRLEGKEMAYAKLLQIG